MINESVHFESIQPNVIVVIVNLTLSSFSHFLLLHLIEWQLIRVLISIDDPWITALDEPHKHLSQAADK